MKRPKRRASFGFRLIAVFLLLMSPVFLIFTIPAKGSPFATPDFLAPSWWGDICAVKSPDFIGTYTGSGKDGSIIIKEAGGRNRTGIWAVGELWLARGEAGWEHRMAGDPQPVGKIIGTPARTRCWIVPGDLVACWCDRAGRVVRAGVAYGMVWGNLAHGKADRLMLEDGTVLDIPPTATLRVDGKSETLAQLEKLNATGLTSPSAWMIIRTDPWNAKAVCLNAFTLKREIGSATEGPTIWGIDGVPQGPLAAGEVMEITVKGTAGGRAIIDLPGLMAGMVMDEVKPGVFRARIKIPGGADLFAARLVVHLVKNDQWARPITSSRFDLAASPPQILDLAPQPGSRVDMNRPQVFCRYRSPGTGIDTEKVRLTVDGQNVSWRSIRNGMMVAWRPENPLGGGVHRVEVVIKDLAGNTTTRSWKFEVAGS